MALGNFDIRQLLWAVAIKLMEFASFLPNGKIQFDTL